MSGWDSVRTDYARREMIDRRIAIAVNLSLDPAHVDIKGVRDRVLREE